MRNDSDSYLLKNNIKHITIPLYSPWAGAAWERMLRTIKSCLYKVIGKQKVGYFDLITLLSHIVQSVNERSLTYNTNVLDFLPVTPNSFLKYESGMSLP